MQLIGCVKRPKQKCSEHLGILVSFHRRRDYNYRPLHAQLPFVCMLNSAHGPHTALAQNRAGRARQAGACTQATRVDTLEDGGSPGRR
jgi:hypothetical protein